MDSACDAYQYQNGDDNKDCSLIEPTADGGQTFTSDEQNYIYVKQQGKYIHPSVKNWKIYRAINAFKKRLLCT